MTKPISHRFQLALSCAGGLLLVLASASYAADAPPDAAVNPTPEAAVSPQPEAVVQSTSSCGRATSRYRDDFCSCWTEGPD